MANKTIELLLDSTGLSVLTVDLFPFGSDTRANGSGDTMTEATNRKGCYQATVTEAITGLHTCHIYDDGVLIKTGVTRFPSDSVGVYRIVPITMADMVYLYGVETSASQLTDFISDYVDLGYPATNAGVWAYTTRTLTGNAPSYSPLHAYQQIRIIKGESYGTGAVKTISMSVSNGSSGWPTDLSTYTWTFVADGAEPATSGLTFSGTVAVDTATGSSRGVSVTITAATTSSASIIAGKYTYSLQGTKVADSTIKTVPESGTLILASNAAA